MGDNWLLKKSIEKLVYKFQVGQTRNRFINKTS